MKTSAGPQQSTVPEKKLLAGVTDQHKHAHAHQAWQPCQKEHPPAVQAEGAARQAGVQEYRGDQWSRTCPESHPLLVVDAMVSQATDSQNKTKAPKVADRGKVTSLTAMPYTGP